MTNGEWNRTSKGPLAILHTRSEIRSICHDKSLGHDLPLAALLVEDERSSARGNTRHAITVSRQTRSADMQPRQTASPNNGLSRLAHVLPPQRICDTLFGSFITGIHPIVPLVHLPTLQKEYNFFWQTYGPGRDIPSKPKHADLLRLLPLIFAVLLGGIMCTPSGLLRDTLREGYTPISLRARLEKAVVIALKIYQFPRSPTLYSLIAFLLLQNFSRCHDELMDNPTMVATMIIAAQKMGLHRDGSHFKLGKVECEIRRRVCSSCPLFRTSSFFEYKR